MLSARLTLFINMVKFPVHSPGIQPITFVNSIWFARAEMFNAHVWRIYGAFYYFFVYSFSMTWNGTFPFSFESDSLYSGTFYLKDKYSYPYCLGNTTILLLGFFYLIERKALKWNCTAHEHQKCHFLISRKIHAYPTGLCFSKELKQNKFYVEK